MRFAFQAAYLVALASLSLASPANALDGGTLRVNPRNDWRAFEIISIGDNPTEDGFDWSMPGTFDGIGAWRPTPDTLRLLINHETSDATISQVDVDLANFKSAIADTISSGAPSGGAFVNSAQQAYNRFSNNGGLTFTATSGTANTSFSRFCSGQSYAPNTFGANRGFVDPIYITGEEVGGGSLFALDLMQRDFYQLSGVTGSDLGLGGGGTGMPFDAWENAALIDTGETDHVALLLSPDGGTRQMKLYIGQKGKGLSGEDSDDFLARNGLAFGSFYFLNDSLPSSGTSSDGFFDRTAADSLASSKLEDVDTSPSNPTQVVLGDQTSGLFTFDFDLAFGAEGFDADASGFSLTKVLDHADNIDGEFGDADNVDWSDATTLGGVSFPEGLIFVNEDTGTNSGEIWMTTPDGSPLTLIGDTAGVSGATETSGILDISAEVGYRAGSVILTNNQGSNSSLAVLINPDAELLSGDFNGDQIVDAADYTIWRDSLGQTGEALAADANGDLVVDINDYQVWRLTFGQNVSGQVTNPAPEPAAVWLMSLVIVLSMARRHFRVT